MTKKEPNENISYVAIIETTLLNAIGEEKTLFPEKIEGNTKDPNAIITLHGHYQDGKPWTMELARNQIKSISWKGPATETPPNA